MPWRRRAARSCMSCWPTPMRCWPRSARRRCRPSSWRCRSGSWRWRCAASERVRPPGSKPWPRSYPGVPLPDAQAAVQAVDALVARVQPLESAAAQAAWVEQVLAHNAELAAAAARTALARTEAARAEQDRLADPTVGVRASRERGGQERVWGVYVSVPIGGAARQAAVAAALAQADRAEREQAQARQRVQAEAWRLLAEALQGVRQAHRQQAAATALVRSAQLQERAWTLGEGTLSDVLLAQRAAAEARLAAERARVDAAAALARLEMQSPSWWADAGR